MLDDPNKVLSDVNRRMGEYRQALLNVDEMLAADKPDTGVMACIVAIALRGSCDCDKCCGLATMTEP
jgi:hypothetical protein